MVDQTFQAYNVSATLQLFYFDQQSEKDSPSIPVLLILKLVFEAPTQRGMMIDDMVRLVYVYILLLRENF